MPIAAGRVRAWNMTPPAAPKRVRRAAKYHHGDLKLATLAEVKRLLARPRERDFSLPEVAKTLGVSHAALYRHFEGKGGILTALSIEGYQRFAEALQAATAGLNGPALLRATSVTYCAFARTEVALFRAMFHPLRQHGPELEAAAQKSFASLGAILLKLNTDLRVAPEMAGAVIWSALHGLAVLETDAWLPGRSGIRPSDLKQLLPETLADVLLLGLRAQVK
jgi:AcrR family transcriptional regulator